MGARCMAFPPHTEFQLSNEANAQRKTRIPKIHIRFRACVALRKMSRKFEEKFQKTAFDYEKNEKPRNVFQVHV